ncbi:hypothetical protein KIH31_01095 [Paenarthrobacter sp. DKR-5]|uniref:hypothetical protein n=1 Tax=Paenarthrobacter sp. DKR-5 TaxID=2835535 RepID=UPI001BDCC898|nr:hypothetical protein [Paenarthrobacter sp. DKR-5]MBT1001183.1 hypothetical protein [Paenarthrobacter sp. DKR-5]
MTAQRPTVKPRLWIWKDGPWRETRGIGLFRGQDLAAHLKPDEARVLADALHDLADHIEATR